MAPSPSLRFRGRREVRRVISHGRRFRHELGRVAWGRTPDIREARVLFTVSTAVARRSTERNRIRRQLTEAFRRQWRVRPFPIAAVVSVDSAVAGFPGRKRNALAAELARRLATLARPP